MRFFFAYNPRMPRRGKLDLDRIRASADVICPHCGVHIPPDRQQRVDFEHMRCPGCGQTFAPSKK